jgi:F0F1-type ATP synthase delta subunit
MDQLDLSEFFATKAQATDFNARLSDVVASLYEVDFDLETFLQHQFGVKKKDKFLTLLRENQVPLDKKPSLNKFLDKIMETITNMPAARMTLAIEPDQQILKSMSNWFLLNLKKQILIETQIDPTLIAGANIEYQGKHFDSSIKSVFDQTYTTYMSEPKDQKSADEAQPKINEATNNTS